MSDPVIPVHILHEFEQDIRRTSGNEARIVTAKVKARVLMHGETPDWNFETRKAIDAELDRVANELLGRGDECPES